MKSALFLLACLLSGCGGITCKDKCSDDYEDCMADTHATVESEPSCKRAKAACEKECDNIKEEETDPVVGGILCGLVILLGGECGDGE